MTYRLGVDVGGTFTDLALYDTESRRLEFAKTPSTPSDQTAGVIQGLTELLDRTGVTPDSVTNFIHGTTVAINALLERKGARTALVTTEGFRDALQIGRQDRPSLYDWRQRRSQPLIPRHLSFEAAERIQSDGTVLRALTDDAVCECVEQVRLAGVEAVAVCLLHSYANPAHERAIGKALRLALPNLTIALSCDVLPEFKEYDRMSTTAINGYVAPGMARYLSSLRDGIADAGIRSELHIMQSNGGVMGADAATERPVQTILSGPAAGVIGGVALAAQAGEGNAISVDMGGTSFDVSLSYRGEVRRTKESEIEGFPVKVPMVDIHTLGAGGGSVAWIDAGGALRVGPRSAGADPGPACYGKGGVEPTVTDANLLLGRLGEGSLLGGGMTLDAGLARQMVEDGVAGPLGLSVEAAAEGIVRVVNAGMIKGIRVVSVARGYDPREFCLVAFGGAGPVHAAELAAELDLPRVLVPAAPGVTSAVGLLMADLRHDFVRTVLRLAESTEPADIQRLYEDMESEAIARMAKEGLSADRVVLQRTVDARYLGQGFELEVPAASGQLSAADTDRVVGDFHDAHLDRYGYAARDHSVELVNLRVTALANLPGPEGSPEPLTGTEDPSGALVDRRPVFFDGKFVEAAIYDRVLLVPGDCFSGPAVVEQLDTTTVVWPGCLARVDAYRNLILERTDP